MINPAEQMVVLLTDSIFNVHLGNTNLIFFCSHAERSSATVGGRPPHCRYIGILCVVNGCCDT